MSDFYCEEVFSGRTAVDKVLETETVLAFHHTKPFWQTHIVVVPKQHIDSLLVLDDRELLHSIFQVIRVVAAAVVDSDGAARILTNLGEYQDSKHLHFHVYAGDKIRD
jgi:histidine triad (HIT) family protein